MTNRSVRTIDTAKFRLRKKLDLPKEVSILSYLRGFTDDPQEIRSEETQNQTLDNQPVEAM